jgi:uncharacterized protein
MKCPNCLDTALLMTERQGVEIDYCPVCRGVWLDRGELDKLIDRAATPEAERATAMAPHQSQELRRDFEDTSPRGGWGRDASSQGRRKKSWMSDIFD